jgi:Fe2+ transport system protein FeoA
MFQQPHTRGVNGPSTVKAQIKCLNELERGQSGLILTIKTSSHDTMQELVSLGISPDAMVEMVDAYAGYVVFKVNQKEFAAEQEIAAGIDVLVFG